MVLLSDGVNQCSRDGTCGADMNANVIPSIDEAVDDGVDQVAVSAQKSSNRVQLPRFTESNKSDSVRKWISSLISSVPKSSETVPVAAPNPATGSPSSIWSKSASGGDAPGNESRSKSSRSDSKFNASTSTM